MKFIITLNRDEDGVWIAECPSIPGCVSQGDSFEDALTNIRDALAVWLEEAADHPDFIAHINRNRIRVEIDVPA